MTDFAPSSTERSRDASSRATETRRLLLEATRSCVRDRGLAGATSREITATAGANLAAITYHFGSKDQLIAEALFGELERRVRPALDAFDEEIAGPSDAVRVMFGVVQHLLAEFERSKDDTLVYLDALLLATRDPAYREQARALYSSLRDQLVAVVTTLIAGGIVPAWVEPVAMASLVLAVANGIVLQSQLDPAGPDHVAMATQFAGLIVAAAAPPDR